MLALVAAPNTNDKIELREVDEPSPRSDEVVMEVRAFSLNRGEVTRLYSAEDGWRPGWDLAGVVLQEAADGSGPREGTRIVGMTFGGWAQRAAVRTSRLAPLPEGVSFEVASSLPVAALTALRCLRVGGLLLGKHVLITGASGGVGHFAVQLAHRAGATVTAVARQGERADRARALGADFVIDEIDENTPRYDLVLESVGGPSLARAIGAAADGGTIVTFGNSARESTTMNVSGFYAKELTLTGFLLLLPSQPAFTSDLEYLLGLVEQGELEVDMTVHGSWRTVGPVLRALRDRTLTGKVVLTVD